MSSGVQRNKHWIESDDGRVRVCLCIIYIARNEKQQRKVDTKDENKAVYSKRFQANFSTSLVVARCLVGL